MNFTYNGYTELINNLKAHGYSFCGYNDWHKSGSTDKVVILRHDIDNDIHKASRLAQLESSLGGGEVSSTYFVLLTSDFYNVFSKESYDGLKEIISCGHEIGLHFDELRYPDLQNNIQAIKSKIMEECAVLSEAVGTPIKTVSMHRPSKAVLDADIQFSNGLINSYGKTFFNDFKYLSDSRRRWRESVDEIISSERYQKLHILTHAFWYNEQELSLRDSLLSFIKVGNVERYRHMDSNFTNLGEEVKESEVACGE